MAKKSDTSTDQVPQDEVARCAYELWEREGRPDGRSTEHWLQAEMLVRGRMPNAATPDGSKARKASSGAAPRREKRFEMVS